MTEAAVSGLREFLEAEVAIRKLMAESGSTPDWTYLSPGDLVLREGVEYEAAAYDPKRWHYAGEAKQCFRDAFLLATIHQDELVYVEGYASGMIPVHHAWCVERGTWKVVDATWAATGHDPSEDVYLGIPFQWKTVQEITEERGRYGVLGDWERGWPLLQQPLDPALLDHEALRKGE